MDHALGKPLHTQTSLYDGLGMSTGIHMGIKTGFSRYAHDPPGCTADSIKRQHAAHLGSTPAVQDFLLSLCEALPS